MGKNSFWIPSSLDLRFNLESIFIIFHLYAMIGLLARGHVLLTDIKVTAFIKDYLLNQFTILISIKERYLCPQPLRALVDLLIDWFKMA